MRDVSRVEPDESRVPLGLILVIVCQTNNPLEKYAWEAQAVTPVVS